MGLITRKRAIVVYNNIKLNPACLASEPSKYSNEVFRVHVRILYLSIAKNKHADQSARMRLCYGHTTKSGFLVKMSISNKDIVIEDINGLIICSNVQKSSDYAKKILSK